MQKIVKSSRNAFPAAHSLINLINGRPARFISGLLVGLGKLNFNDRSKYVLGSRQQQSIHQLCSHKMLALNKLSYFVVARERRVKYPWHQMSPRLCFFKPLQNFKKDVYFILCF